MTDQRVGTCHDCGVTFRDAHVCTRLDAPAPEPVAQPPDIDALPVQMRNGTTIDLGEVLGGVIIGRFDALGSLHDWIEVQQARIAELEEWQIEAVSALEAASIIGARSCRPGDGLHLSNHDRLVRLANATNPVLIRLRAALEGSQPTEAAP